MFAYFRIVTVMWPYISLSPTRMCTNDNADYFVLGMFIRTVLGKVSMDLSLALSYCNQLPDLCVKDTRAWQSICG